ncbi:kinetoplast DNA-associated protein [Strigomonas culicis]|nr:kinetoplast DNA-associated protein [Strigomonas culicis]|eukprot:EPY19359.1 kinetoplast DNA-associated protein [Strigomonas culicis]
MRERARKQMEAEVQFHETMSFKPTICPTSAALDYARNDKDALNVAFPTSMERGELLYYQNMAKEERKASEATRVTSAVRAPVTNPTSEDWIQNSEHKYLFERDFITRQEVYQQARAKMQVLEEQQREAAERERRAEPAAQPVEQMARRLYYEPKATQAARQAGRRERKEKEERESCTFAPQLAPGTKHVLGKLQKREPDVVKRLAGSAEDGSKAREGSVGEDQLKDQTNCLTAKSGGMKTTRWVSSCARTPSAKAPSPATKLAAEGTKEDAAPVTADAPPPPPKRMTREEMKKFYERQMETLSARERFVDDARKVELLQESAACTFQPHTNTSSSAPAWDSASVDGSRRHGSGEECRTEAVVLGVNEYLKRQAAARRLKEDKEERLRNMGRSRSGRPTGGRTAIEAFHFQTEEMSARRMRRMNSFV